ncbi:MAG: hypothetical protein H6706_06790 [Myxococcales bacterium]|nr:hypothetical protein [Myxococcales bacterium]
MGLFGGGGALKRRVDELEAQLESARAEADAARRAKAEVESRLAEKDKALQAAEKRAQEATEGARKAKAKADKAAQSKGDVDRREQALKSRVEHLEAEAAEFRQAMLEARRDAESAHAARFDLQREVEALRARGPERVVVAPEPVVTPVVTPAPRRQDHPRDDMIVEHLEEKVNELKGSRDSYKERLTAAEKLARDADRKLKSELGKADAVLRDLQHNLSAERKAYRILQLQFEALVDKTRGLDQLVESRVADLVSAQQSGAAPAAPAAEAAPVATVLPDAPPVVGDGGDA